MADKKKEKKTKIYVAGARTCPKCGPGIHLATHPNRFSCGKCGYMETRDKPVAQ